MSNTSSDSSWGWDHLSGLPVTVSVAVVIGGALLLLCLLRHLFGNIRVEAGTN